MPLEDKEMEALIQDAGQQMDGKGGGSTGPGMGGGRSPTGNAGAGGSGPGGGAMPTAGGANIILKQVAARQQRPEDIPQATLDKAGLTVERLQAVWDAQDPLAGSDLYNDIEDAAAESPDKQGESASIENNSVKIGEILKGAGVQDVLGVLNEIGKVIDLDKEDLPKTVVVDSSGAVTDQETSPYLDHSVTVPEENADGGGGDTSGGGGSSSSSSTDSSSTEGGASSGSPSSSSSSSSSDPLMDNVGDVTTEAVEGAGMGGGTIGENQTVATSAEVDPEPGTPETEGAAEEVEEVEIDFGIDLRDYEEEEDDAVVPASTKVDETQFPEEVTDVVTETDNPPLAPTPIEVETETTEEETSTSDSTGTTTSTVTTTTTTTTGSADTDDDGTGISTSEDDGTGTIGTEDDGAGDGGGDDPKGEDADPGPGTGEDDSTTGDDGTTGDNAGPGTESPGEGPGEEEGPGDGDNDGTGDNGEEGPDDGPGTGPGDGEGGGLPTNEVENPLVVPPPDPYTPDKPKFTVRGYFGWEKNNVEDEKRPNAWLYRRRR